MISAELHRRKNRRSVAIDRSRLEDGPWLEGTTLRLDREIAPSWPLAGYERSMLDAAIELIEAER